MAGSHCHDCIFPSVKKDVAHATVWGQVRAAKKAMAAKQAAQDTEKARVAAEAAAAAMPKLPLQEVQDREASHKDRKRRTKSRSACPPCSLTQAFMMGVSQGTLASCLLFLLGPSCFVKHLAGEALDLCGI